MRQKRKRGFVAVLGVFMIAILVSTMAYLFEVGRLLSAKIVAQNAADAGALTGAHVFAGLRNTMVLENALMDMWRDIAENAAHHEGNFFWAATGGVGFLPGTTFQPGAYQVREDDLGSQDNDPFIQDMRRMYHRAFRVQDAAVSRFLAVHQTRVHQFRNGVGIYSPNQMRQEMRRMVEQVVRLNVYRPGLTNPSWWLLGWLFYDPGFNNFPNFINLFGGITPGFGVTVNPNNAPSWADNAYQHNYRSEFKLDSLGRVYVHVQAPLQPSTIMRLLPLNWFGQGGSLGNLMNFPWGGCAQSPTTNGYIIFRGVSNRGGYILLPQINPTVYALPGLAFSAPNKVCADAAAGVKKYTGGFLRLTDLHLYANFNMRYFGQGLPFAGRSFGSFRLWQLWPWIAGIMQALRQDLADGLLTRIIFAGNPRIDGLEWYHAQLIPTVKTEYGPIGALEPYH